MLTKDTLSVLVDPGTAGRPAVSGSAFHLFAPPPAKAYQFNAPTPASMVAFYQWKQLIKVEIDETPNYLTYAAFVAKYGTNGSFAGWSPVYSGVVDSLGNRAILGFERDPQVPAPQVWFSAPSGMTYMQARGVSELAPNGYPLNTTEADFYFTIGGVEYGARYKRADGSFGGNFYFRRWITAPPPAEFEMRGWTGVLAVPGMPGSPPAAAVPPTYRLDYLDGWNAGADSVARYDGDVETVFQHAIKAAGAVGFARDGAVIDGRFERLSHAFFFSGSTCQPMESGRLVGAPQVVPADSVFTLRRIGGVVRYLIGSTLVHESMVPSGGPLQVSAALYHGTDQVI